jgi:hypothetical protein
METSASSSYGWALHELGFADFNDERLTKRAVHIAASLLQNPQQSISSAMEEWAQTKATYRFFANDKIQSPNMLSAHQEQTVNRCQKEKTILVAQDTTTMNLSNKHVRGLGRIGMRDLQGFFTHSALAMTTQGLPLGLLYQKTYVRKEGTQTRAYKKRYKQMPITEKETGKWVEVVDTVAHQLKGRHVVVIGDRESDIFDVFKTAKENTTDLLVRTCKNRLILDEAGQERHLFATAQTGKLLTRYETLVPTTKDAHQKRKASLTLRVTHCLLPVATYRRGEKQIPVPVRIVDVMEENPPEGEEPIHWVLTTTLNISTPEEAIEKVQWYMCRWRIERFHYVLKTGAFNVEKLQFESFTRFKKAITMFSIVAWKVLCFLYQSRESPNDSAETVFSPEEIQALSLIAKKQIDTIHEAVIQTAKLGGYLARKRDGPAGIKTLWIGFQKLTNIVYGMMMAKEAKIV